MATSRNHNLIAMAWILLSQHTPTSDAFSSSPVWTNTTPRLTPPAALTLRTKRGKGASSSFTSLSSSSSSTTTTSGTGIGDVESSTSSSPPPCPSATATTTAVFNDGGGAGGAASSSDDGCDVPEMPWSDAQESALRSSVPKYSFFVAPSASSSATAAVGGSGAGGGGEEEALLLRQVSELAGYPPAFLRRMHLRNCGGRRDDDDDRADVATMTTIADTPGMLPMVDEYDFSTNGGIVGRVYGLPGVADGTIIRTPSLVRAEGTVPFGYVTTMRVGGGGGECDCYDDDDDDEYDGVGPSYELGTMISSSSSSSSSSTTARSAALAAAARRLTLGGRRGDMIDEGEDYSSRRVVDLARGMAETRSGLLTDAESNRDLVYLGGATAMLLAGASAVSALSHHLTVNVFWV
ncbi:hypothetical protein ACHAXA_001746 [Cyclostephanos tholiformis]|uniref:Uncharacterized protein n=1 Tax=Cyclostephanos tholiformis TaxID=382380 RepID=A0ABD3SCV5_9STRA